MSQLSTNFAEPRLVDAGPDGDAARADVAARVQIAKDGEFHSLGLVLGYQYGDSPVIVADGTSEPHGRPIALRTHGTPGARLPHQWLPDGRSVYDALGRDLTLMCLDPGADPSPFVVAASARGTPLHVLDLCRLGCTRADLAERYGAAMLLVRPDQHVAWRCTSTSVDENRGRVLIQATGK